MDIKELRLELVKLTHHHGKQITDAVERAKALEVYILESEDKPTGIPEKRNPGRPKARQPVIDGS